MRDLTYQSWTFFQSVKIPPVTWAPHSIKWPAKLKNIQIIVLAHQRLYHISSNKYWYIWKAEFQSNLYKPKSCEGQFKFNITLCPVMHYKFNITLYYEFSLLHIFLLVLQPWMSAYIRKTDGVYISVPKND